VIIFSTKIIFGIIIGAFAGLLLSVILAKTGCG